MNEAPQQARLAAHKRYVKSEYFSQQREDWQYVAQVDQVCPSPPRCVARDKICTLFASFSPDAILTGLFPLTVSFPAISGVARMFLPDLFPCVQIPTLTIL